MAGAVWTARSLQSSGRSPAAAGLFGASCGPVAGLRAAHGTVSVYLLALLKARRAMGLDGSLLTSGV